MQFKITYATERGRKSVRGGKDKNGHETGSSSSRWDTEEEAQAWIDWALKNNQGYDPTEYRIEPVKAKR